MAHWLVKSEPHTWSWDEHVRDEVTSWTGVRNHQAAIYLKTMKVGDTAFFYHSGDEKRIVGIVEVVKEAYPDATDPTGRFVTVDLKALRPVEQPVTLAAIKADARLADLLLVRHSRLSVSPVGDEHWKIICGMGGTAP